MHENTSISKREFDLNFYESTDSLKINKNPGLIQNIIFLKYGEKKGFLKENEMDITKIIPYYIMYYGVMNLMKHVPEHNRK